MRTIVYLVVAIILGNWMYSVREQRPRPVLQQGQFVTDRYGNMGMIETWSLCYWTEKSCKRRIDFGGCHYTYYEHELSLADRPKTWICPPQYARHGPNNDLGDLAAIYLGGRSTGLFK